MKATPTRTPACTSTTVAAPPPRMAASPRTAVYMGGWAGALGGLLLDASLVFVPITMIAGAVAGVYCSTFLQDLRAGREIWVTTTVASLQETYCQLWEEKASAGASREILESSKTAVENVLRKLAMPRNDWSRAKDEDLQEKGRRALEEQLELVRSL